MRFINSINFKIFIGILLILAILMAGMALSLQWSFERSFLHYVNTSESRFQEQFIIELANFYEKENSWEKLRQNLRLWRRLKLVTLEKAFEDEDSSSRFMPMPRRDVDWDDIHDSNKEMMMPESFSHDRTFSSREKRALTSRPAVALLDENHRLIVGRYQNNPDIEFKPVKVNDKTVGYLAVRPLRKIVNRHDQAFIRHLGESLYIIVIIMTLLSLLLSYLLSRSLVDKIKSLKNATHELTAGNYKISLPADSRDELGLLAEDFNSLAKTLEKNELARREWLADISHELRTPLSILRGELEAIQDGVRQITPETRDRLYTEVMSLERLVHDLYELTMSDIGALNYQKKNCNPVKILSQNISVFSNEYKQKKIDLHVDNHVKNDTTIFADVDRLNQLFSNLLTNSLRYTDSGGKVVIEIHKNNHDLNICFIDSAPGVPEQDLDKLFERLYRQEASRNRASGGAGLGLSICRNIVEAHEGTITASKSNLGGLKIDIVLPVEG